MASYLDFQSLNKRFEPGTINEKIALDNFTLKAPKGDFITILGSNGAGKSTLFNAILGKFPLDSGKILVDGEDITYQKDYRRALNIGCLFQDPLRGTAPNMTIEENLALAYTRKSSRSLFAVNRKNTAVFREWLSTLHMGLEDRMKSKMGTLSGGQRQAAALLMATIARPKLLLLDEHTAALDPAASEKVLRITKDIVAEHGLTTLMITHDMNYALECGNRTIVMDAGRLILDIQGDERRNMTPLKLTDMFINATKSILTDRSMLTSRQ
ncbi:MAG: ABC transporter ATP-binding protein [Christensenellales bacterium]|jgi:putative ABC transport system ATP-binding protein